MGSVSRRVRGAVVAAAVLNAISLAAARGAMAAAGPTIDTDISDIVESWFTLLVGALAVLVLSVIQAARPTLRLRLTRGSVISFVTAIYAVLGFFLVAPAFGGDGSSRPLFGLLLALVLAWLGACATGLGLLDAGREAMRTVTGD